MARASTKTPPKLKDSLGSQAVARLAAALTAADPEFPAARFRRRAARGLSGMELKQRVLHVIDALDACLPDDFEQALEQVVAAGSLLPPAEEGDTLAGLAAWPLIDWVPKRGVEHFEAAMAALPKLTGLFSAEFAVRPFILHDPARALEIMTAWTDSPDEQVRRLASEGCRPRLPWGVRLPCFVQDPSPVLSLLDLLKDDPADFVRRSVANNLNDIAKDHPGRVVRTAARWMKGASQERARLVRHALRSLVKAGDPGAMEILGFTTRPRVKASLTLDRQSLAIGQSLALEVRLRSTSRSTQKLVVDYAVHHVKKSGATTAKVFKLRTVELPPGGEVRLKKRHSFVPRSVRRYYPGRHAVELLVAGQSMARRGFTLEE